MVPRSTSHTGRRVSRGCLMIVANTIRLAVYTRQDELDILALVGASRSFVRIPFLLEGILQGAVGGLIAVALLFLSFQLVLPQLEQGFALLLGSVRPHFFSGAAVAWVLVAGAGLGLFGSAMALVGWRPGT